MKKKIKRYKMINKKDAKKEMAFTDNPAIQVKGIYFSKDKESKSVDVKFYLQEEKKMVVGPAMIPNLDIIKFEDGEFKSYYADEEYIREFAYDFINQQDGAKFNFNHMGNKVDALLVNTMILESELDVKYIKNKYGYDLPLGTWWIEAKILDEIFWSEAIKKGKYHSFSIETESYIEDFGDLEVDYDPNKKVIKMSEEDSIDLIISNLIKEIL